MQAFSPAELKLVFLQSRDSWLTNILASIPADDGKRCFNGIVCLCVGLNWIFILAQQHLIKTIELTRVNLFNIITQYKATFGDEETNFAGKESSQSGSIFYSWLHKKVITSATFRGC